MWSYRNQRLINDFQAFHNVSIVRDDSTMRHVDTERTVTVNDKEYALSNPGNKHNCEYRLSHHDFLHQEVRRDLEPVSRSLILSNEQFLGLSSIPSNALFHLALSLQCGGVGERVVLVVLKPLPPKITSQKGRYHTLPGKEGHLQGHLQASLKINTSNEQRHFRSTTSTSPVLPRPNAAN